MSTDLMAYLNYMSTWDSESDDNINKVISEQQLFASVGSFSSDDAINAEFDTLTGLATTTFGLGMTAFAALEAAEAIERKVISDKSKELNEKLKTIDTDISARINKDVNLYVTQYKANNNLIASKAPKGLDTRRFRAILMQFMAQVHKAKGTIDIATFKQYAESARTLYNSAKINDVYDALDKLNLSDKSDDDVKQFIGFLKGLDFNSTALTIIRNVSIAIMAYKLNIANKKIANLAKEAGLEVPEVEESAFGMMDAVGKFVAVVAVVMSVVDTVLDILDIVDVVEQTKKMCDELDGSIKDSYKAYFDGITKASQQYNAAMDKA
ncbi:hypothetical protein F5144DRAFT_649563 [Chaetomium tenue]|uniref:Uncharacterized protein n=1 Tax=Chaetomium tenue TaxID=1854479 RepID=A0ACB7P793_9PEZI|nr:hypothetical protein F5144DRAFT_649563 [Chaetomium globosum]